MKKFLLILFAVCLSSVTWAYEFSDDSTGTTFYYNFGVGGIEVTWGGESETSGTTAYMGVIVIPEEVTYNGDTYFVTGIGEYAFYNCEGLTNIVISNQVTYISQYAFSYCSSLTEATIGSSVKTIGVEAFSQCTSLMNITSLNSAPPTCGNDAFAGVPSEATLYVEEGAVWDYSSASQWSDFNIVACYDPFDGAEIVWQDIYYRVLSTEEKTLEVVEYYGPHGAVNYTGDIVIPSSFFYYGMPFTVIGVGEGGFYGCYELTSIVLPETITYVGDSGFYECSAITSIVLPEAVTYIEPSTFHDCSSLKEVNLSNISSIGENAFQLCSSLKEVDLSKASSIGEDAFESCFSLESVTLCDELTSIENSVFANCVSLESIHLPESVTTIGDSGFLACSSLKDINLGNITSLGESCFDGCALTSIDISKVTTIPARAFMSCDDLEEVIFSDQLTEIGDYAMYDCNSFNQTLPESVTTLGRYSLAWCRSLTSVEFPNVETIGDYAFCYDRALETVSLGDKLTSIGNSAFSSCSKMTSITSLNPTPPECGTDVFNSVDLHSCVLYVDEGCLDAYKEASVWMDFYNIVEMIHFHIATLEPTDISETSATLNGTVTAAYNEPITAKGFEYWVSDSDGVNQISMSGEESGETSVIACSIQNLSPGTSYTYRVYAITDNDTYYGEDVEFKTDGDPETEGISNVSADNEEVQTIYSVGGQKLSNLQHGVNIVKYTDGTVKKVLGK